MSKLTKFIGVAEDVEVMGETLKLYPLTMKDLGLIEKMDELEKKKANLTDLDKKEITKLGRDMIITCYKDEHFTEEEIENMSLNLYSELYTTMMQKMMYEMQHGKGLTRIRELKAKTISESTPA